MFEIAMYDQMFIATNKLPGAANDGHCGSASCGNRGDGAGGNNECVNLNNAATGNEDYLYIEGAFSPNTMTAALGGSNVMWVFDY